MKTASRAAALALGLLAMSEQAVSYPSGLEKRKKQEFKQAAFTPKEWKRRKKKRSQQSKSRAINRN